MNGSLLFTHPDVHAGVENHFQASSRSDSSDWFQTFMMDINHVLGACQQKYECSGVFLWPYSGFQHNCMCLYLQYL